MLTTAGSSFSARSAKPRAGAPGRSAGTAGALAGPTGSVIADGAAAGAGVGVWNASADALGPPDPSASPNSRRAAGAMARKRTVSVTETVSWALNLLKVRPLPALAESGGRAAY